MELSRRTVLAQAAALAVPTGRGGGAPAANVVALGADPSGKADSTSAFQAAARAVEAASGGDLLIPPGRYRVGRQSFAGAKKRGFAYQGEDIVAIRGCAQPVRIRGAGATLTMPGGLRYGSFDPISGQPFPAPVLPFYDRDFAATLGCFFNFERNASVTLEGPLVLDGAIQHQQIGGLWGDTGRQLIAIGVRAYNNQRFTLTGLRSFNQGLDHLVIGWSGLKAGAPAVPHRISDVRGAVCGRNGFSWVGGNDLVCVDCRFERSGKAPGLLSAPAAGVDIEAEDSVCRNGVFQRLACIDNAGAGVTLEAGDVADMVFRDSLFVGSSSWAAWPHKPGLLFERCRFVGPLVHVFGDLKDPRRAARFVDCVNSFDPRLSPTGRLYPRDSDFSDAGGAQWIGGRIDPGHAVGLARAPGGPGLYVRP